MSLSYSIERGNDLSSLPGHHLPTKTKKSFQQADLPEQTTNNELSEAIKCEDWDGARILLSYRGNKRLLEQHLMNWRRTALHFACIYDAPIDIVLSLVCIFRGACLMQDIDGRTPLSFACEFASSETIIALLKACPEAVFVADNDGDLPICGAIGFRRKLHVIELFLQIYPSSVTKPNFNGVSALQKFFREGFFKWDKRRVIRVSSLLLQASLETCKFDPAASKRGRPWLLLHGSIVEPHVPWAFAVFFFEKHAAQIGERNEDGNLPLHLLCYSTKPFHDIVFDALFEAFPMALCVKNYMGLTPLDVALLRGCDRTDRILTQSETTASVEDSTVGQQDESEKAELEQINTIFWLLLKDPSVVGRFGPGFS